MQESLPDACLVQIGAASALLVVAAGLGITLTEPETIHGDYWTGCGGPSLHDELAGLDLATLPTRARRELARLVDLVSS